jgi:POT family proton-dependent oligopeptide transporter
VERSRAEYLSSTPLTEVQVTKDEAGKWMLPAIVAQSQEGASGDGFITFTATQEQADQGLGVNGQEIKASVFQAANAMFILIFGVPFTLLWAWLGARGRDPSAPVKFGLGLLQLALGFGAFWYGAKIADSNGMVAMVWLLLGYLLHTTGELCLSPVGLSLVTKLSPARMVSTIMGAWFLATAFSHLVAAAIANYTAVAGDDPGTSLPTETLGAYGEVFGSVAIAAMAAGFLLLLMSPFLKRMMHMDLLGKDPAPAAH